MNLYSEFIRDLNKSPKNFKKIDGLSIEAYNPLCGDSFTLYFKIKDNIIEESSFLGEGCAISVASASIMTEAVKGKKVDEALEILQEIKKMTSNLEFNEKILGKMRIFKDISQYPSRIKCLTLSWNGLKSLADA